MKTSHLRSSPQGAFISSMLGIMVALAARGQFVFNSGSDGSYGPLNITTNTTLALPTNGIFNCTTINIASNATLHFTRNDLNTPVYLLATSNILVNGTIDVSAAGRMGGPGGFDGGMGPYLSLPAGDGHGPGAGRAVDPTAGPASYGTAGSAGGGTALYGVGAIYGSPLLVPLVGGSGSCGNASGDGAGGGGAVLLASNTRIDLAGSVTASGASGGLLSLGSGGAIRVIAPLLAGTGSLAAAGGRDFWNGFYNNGGVGRIRMDCMMNQRGLTFALNGVASVGANMTVFPTNFPHLDITQVGTNTILLGAGSLVSFTLPAGASTNQTIGVQASNFGTVVPIRVVLTPDSGLASSFDTNIDNTINPASVTVPVVVPVNIQVQVNAWTR